MKTVYSFPLLFIILLHTGCTKDDPEYYDPEETLITINTDNWDDQYSYFKAFIVIENRESAAVFAEMTMDETKVIKRGNDIYGNLFNIHFVYINTIMEEADWRIISYFDIQPGKEIELKDMYESSSQDRKSGFVNKISFTDIPDFDVATRSAMTQRHCHTLSTLEVPCTDSFFAGEYFYVCLQTGDDAGYMLVQVPAVSEFIISLSNLNYDMQKFRILKNPDYTQTINITAYGCDDPVEIFHLSNTDEAIFPNDVDVFVPDGLPQMTSFGTTFFKYGTNHIQTAYYRDSEVTISNSYIDAGLSLRYESGNFPEISDSSDDIDFLTTNLDIRDKDNLNTWTVISPAGGSIYKPSFPSEVLHAVSDDFNLDEILTRVSYISVRAVSDSRLGNYDDAVNSFLGITQHSEEVYSILTDRIWLSDE